MRYAHRDGMKAEQRSWRHAIVSPPLRAKGRAARHFAFFTFSLGAGVTPAARRAGDYPYLLILLKWLFLQPAALVALIPRGCDSLVLTVREPRVAGDVPQVGEVAFESVLTP